MKSRKSPLMTIAAAAFLAACAVSGVQSQSFDQTAEFWRDPVFLKKFMGTYGARSEIEPKFKTPEEQEFFRGLSQTMRENPERAIQTLSAQIKPDSSAILNFTLATLRFQNGETSEAIKQYEMAIAKFPDFQRAHKNLGMTLVREGDYGRAIEHLTQALELGGGDGNVFGLLGFGYLNQEEYVSAETAYRSALLLSPAVADWKLGLLKALIAQNRLDEANALLNELLKKQPESEALLSLQGTVYLQLDKPNEAIVTYELLRRMGQASFQSLMLLGDIYMTQDAKELALSAYLDAMDLPGTPSPDRALRAADALTGRGAWTEARAMFGKIRDVHGSSISPEDELALLKLESRVALANEEGEKAAETLEQIVERNPLDGEALLMLGDYYKGAGDIERAQLRYEFAEKISGFQAQSLVKQAQLLVEQRKYPQAVELLRRAQQIRPRDNIAKYLEAVERVSRAGS